MQAETKPMAAALKVFLFEARQHPQRLLVGILNNQLWRVSDDDGTWVDRRVLSDHRFPNYHSTLILSMSASLSLPPEGVEINLFGLPHETFESGALQVWTLVGHKPVFTQVFDSQRRARNKVPLLGDTIDPLPEQFTQGTLATWAGQSILFVVRYHITDIVLHQRQALKGIWTDD